MSRSFPQCNFELEKHSLISITYIYVYTCRYKDEYQKIEDWAWFETAFIAKSLLIDFQLGFWPFIQWIISRGNEWVVSQIWTTEKLSVDLHPGQHHHGLLVEMNLLPKTHKSQPSSFVQCITITSTNISTFILDKPLTSSHWTNHEAKSNDSCYER